MSRVVRFHRVGGPEVLQIDTVAVPAPEKGEVRIAVKALGLNRAEAMFRSGQYLEDPQFPSKLGYEASGTIEAVGPGVTGFNLYSILVAIAGAVILLFIVGMMRRA